VTEIMSMAKRSGYIHLRAVQTEEKTMTINGIYQAIIDWAARPSVNPDNENAVWLMSPRDQADLPIGHEPDIAPNRIDSDRRDRCA
jgi:hypothetical protein